MKLKHLFLYFCIISIALCSGCKNQSDSSPISKTGFFFDTYISITLYDEAQQEYLEECMNLCEKYQKLFDKNTADSDIYNLNHSAGAAVSCAPETLDIINKSIAYSQHSQGIFDITVGALSELWNITSNSPVVPTDAAITATLASVDYQNIQISASAGQLQLGNPDTHIDLGAIAKGYIADKLKEYLCSQGVEHGLINLGGNILLIHDKPDHSDYKIGIQKPFSNMGETIATVSITDKSIVTSGIYQRYIYENDTLYHHILDTSTGYPVETDVTGVTIISDLSIDGDCYSTICLALGFEKGMAFVESLPGIEGIFITKENEIHLTSGLQQDGDVITLKMSNPQS